MNTPLSEDAKWPVEHAKKEEPGLVTGPQLPTQEPAVCLTHLVAALVQQTEALNRLAASNEALSQGIASLIEEMGKGEEEQGDEPVGYLNARR
jgi:hypothetical protein